MTRSKVAARHLFDAGRYLHEQAQHAKLTTQQYDDLHEAMLILAVLYNALLGDSNVSGQKPIQR